MQSHCGNPRIPYRDFLCGRHPLSDREYTRRKRPGAYRQVRDSPHRPFRDVCQAARNR